HVVSNKGVVGGADTELHRQVKAGRGFPATRDAKQYHLRLVEVTQRNTVVVRQGVINGGDTRIVFGQVAGVQPVRSVGDRRRVEFQFALQRGHQRLDDILTEPFTLQNNRANFRDHDGVEDQRADPRLLEDGVNLV